VSTTDALGLVGLFIAVIALTMTAFATGFAVAIALL
jgi:hypothetical protein